MSLISENILSNISKNLDIRKDNNLFDSEKKLLKKSNLNITRNIEAWTAVGTNNQLSYATHGIFRYFGKFPPPIASHLIKTYTNENDIVWDPMCGSGTTGVECLLLNRKCVLSDINPLSVLLAKVKTKFIDENILRGTVNEIIQNYRPLSEREYNFNPIGLKNADHWFLADTKNSLRGLKKMINREKNVNIKNFLLAVFAATIRRVSRATTQQGRLFLDVDTAQTDALPTFIKRAKIAIKGVSSLPIKHQNTKIFSFNLKESLPLTHNQSAQLIILHPPYFNSYKYSRINSLEMSWLGYDCSLLRKYEVREFFKVGKPDNVSFYIDDMVKVVKNVSKILRPTGIMAIMIGDTIIKNRYIPVTKMLIDHICGDELGINSLALRVPRYTEASWVTSQRRKNQNIGVTLYDFILILKRKG
jgi:DNA modification methylase